MHESAQFLADLTLTLAGGIAAGWLARKVGLHPILGYVVAGIVVGPFTPGYTTQVSNLAILSELGLVFLMFTIGLEFSIADIKEIGATPLALALVAMGVVIAAGIVGAYFAGLPAFVTLGLILVLSSTAIGIALLKDAGLIDERAGKLIVSILIVQDLIAILLLVLIDQPKAELSVGQLVKPLIQSTIFVGFALTLGSWLARKLVVQTLKSADEDQQIVVFAGIALGAAYLAHLADLSFAFGAFIAGAVVAGIPESTTVERLVAPFKDLFVLCFFVAIGSVIDPALIMANWTSVILFGLAIIFVRWLIWAAFAKLCGFNRSTAVLIGIAMVPLGEFNVVLAQAGHAAQRLNATELATCIGVMFLSVVAATLAQPLVLRRLRKA